MSKEKKVLVFGVFDGLHNGHRFFLREAGKLGNHLVVAVAHDEAVEKLKQRAPRQRAAARADAIIAEKLAHEVIVGDREQGSWEVLKKIRPDIIALGYDQDALHDALKECSRTFDFDFEIVRIEPHEPKKFHSSILQDLNT